MEGGGTTPAGCGQHIPRPATGAELALVGDGPLLTSKNVGAAFAAWYLNASDEQRRAVVDNLPRPARPETPQPGQTDPPWWSRP